MVDREEPELVFIPPLATVLASEAQKRRRRLTAAEVFELRDAATVVATPPDAARKIHAERGYRDVNPEDAWADWHRLRVEFTGDGCLPRIVLCVAGTDLFRYVSALEQAGFETDLRGADPRMLAAFAASRFGFSTIAPADLDRIAHHDSVLYVLGKNATERECAGVAASLLGATRPLLESGAPGIKCDSSGVAHSAAGWGALAEDLASPSTRMSALLRAYVQLPIGDGRDYYSCGMHLLGRPDLIVSHEAIATGYPEADAPRVVFDLLSSFALYLLDECPEGGFATGHTFRTDPSAPRFRASFEECRGYDEDDFFFNPFGRWRLDPDV